MAQPKPSRVAMRIYYWIRSWHSRLVALFLLGRIRSGTSSSSSSTSDTYFFVMGLVALLVLLVGGLAVAVGVGSAVIWLYKHSQCYSREAGVTWHEGAAHSMRRPCPAVNYETLPTTTSEANSSHKPHICMTTLSDGGAQTSWWDAMVSGCRNFNDVAPLTWPNQQRYAQRHGYTAQENSHLLDPSRPPAWSKIRAAQHMLDLPAASSTATATQQKQYKCDWVLWLDADVVIMNSSIALESLIPADPNIHMVVTSDRRFTANSGVWLLRNNDWSRQFLSDWWNMKTWVRQKGLSLSGDNDAFGHLVRQRLQLDERTWTAATAAAAASTNAHIRMPARCNMNSFGAFVTDPALSDPAIFNSLNDEMDEKPEWYQSELFYHAGDFIAHASGIDQKGIGVEFLLQRAT